ncbi:MAG: phosphoethanolamine transferase [Fibrobacterota bacterium]
MKSLHLFMLRHGFAAGLILLLVGDLFVLREPGWVFSHSGARFWVNYLLSLLGLLGCLYILRAAFNRNRGTRFLGLMLILAPCLIQAGYFSVYKKYLTPFAFSFFTENPAMTAGFNRNFFPYAKALVFLPLCAYATFLLFQSAPRFRPVRATAAGLLFLAFLAHSVFGWYSYYDFENAPMAFNSALTENIIRSAGTFRVDRPVVPKRRSGSAPTALVWILGESTVRDHMSLYGYARKTTPFLDSLSAAGRLLAFTNAVTVGNKTNLSVPYMLAGLEGPDPNGVFYHTPTVFNYARAAGFATAFISAQDLRWGHLEKILVDASVDLFRDGSFFSPSVNVMKGADDMIVVKRGILPYLDTVRSPFLLVYQMDGSHYPYTDHCPESCKRFLPEEGENSVSAYDNTVAYTDAALSLLINKVQSRFPDAWIVFTPDHGQSVDNGQGAFNESFYREVICNPLLMIAPADRMPALRRNLNAPVSQADILPTLLDVMGMTPVRPLDGYSLLRPVSASRLRLCSEYMPTFHNSPKGVLFLPDGAFYTLDFIKRSAESSRDSGVVPFRELAPEFQEHIQSRLTRGAVH